MLQTLGQKEYWLECGHGCLLSEERSEESRGEHAKPLSLNCGQLGSCASTFSRGRRAGACTFGVCRG